MQMPAVLETLDVNGYTDQVLVSFQESEAVIDLIKAHSSRD